MNNTNTNTNANKSNSTKINPTASHSADLSGWEEKIMTAVSSLGEMIERAGEKTEGRGFEKIGQAINQLGEKIERLGSGPRKFSNKDQSVDSSEDRHEEPKVKYNS